MTIILDNYSPSTLQGVRLGGRKSPRIIVGENSCHFGASLKNLRGINFVKLRNIFSSIDPESGHSCFVFVQYPRDSPRSAWELPKKIGAATNSRKNYKKKNTKKKREGN